jgi:hypothetical protein
MLDQTNQDDAHGLGQELRAAKAATLARQATSAEAKALTEVVCTTAYEHSTNKRGVLLGTVAAFLGDLLKVDPDEWVRLSTRPAAFTGRPITRSSFIAVADAMEAAGLIEKKPGYVLMNDGVMREKRSTRYKATSKLWALAAEHGIRNSQGHFTIVNTKVVERLVKTDPIGLRSFSEWTDDGKVKGTPLEFDKTAPAVLALARDVEKINAFWEDHELLGGTHRGFTRIFHKPAVLNGSGPYGWNMGGRLYSAGEGYQTMSKDDRLRMTIDGESVAELDVQASYLTIFQAQQGNPLDVYSGEDPYALTALDTREAFTAIP